MKQLHLRVTQKTIDIAARNRARDFDALTECLVATALNIQHPLGDGYKWRVGMIFATNTKTRTMYKIPFNITTTIVVWMKDEKPIRPFECDLINTGEW